MPALVIRNAMRLNIRFMKKLFTVLILLYLLCYEVKAQQNNIIEGTVTGINGTGLAGVNVFFEGTKHGSATNGEGYFRINNLAPGTYQLKASLVGYETYSQPVEVTTGMLFIAIQLQEHLYDLPEVVIARETLTGGSNLIKDIPGAAHYIGPKELEKFNYSDINRILRNIPGINLQEEEGFGLRPNIGMRGTGVERSSKITLMEDGILSAPAPYVAPAAYYFPTVGRMEGVEVRKGSSQIKYGPYTTGGAINFISTSIPRDFSAKVNILGGNYGRRTAHAAVGQSFRYGGFLLESYQNTSTGFKDLDNGGPTGFYNQDYLAKVRVNSPQGAKIFQSLTFKAGQAIGNAEETYLGLTDKDFNQTPNRRYAASQLDNIKTDQSQLSFKYNIIPAKHLDVSITGYRNSVKRNWYKLDKVKYDVGSKVAIADVLDEPDLYQNEYALLTGVTGPNDDALFMKNNNRKYAARGIQSVVGLNFDLGLIKHDIEIGFRYHQDEEDRYQWEDAYTIKNGVMGLTQAGTPGTESNRISNATASAAYLQYSFKYGDNFHVQPGLRYERIDLARKDFGKNDAGRTGDALKETSNNVDIWIPGIGLAYNFNPDVQTFLGVHRGFTPPGAREDTKPEKSINYELGTRINRPHLNTQAVLFFNDYQNLLGSDLAAAGGGGTGDQFNAGEAQIYGAEAEISYYFELDGSGNVGIPVMLTYTYTDGKFKSSFNADNEDWGIVQKDDHLPYLSNHQLAVSIGIEHKRFNVNVSSKYLSDMRTIPGQGDIPEITRINSNFIVDFSANVKISREVTVFYSINNLTNEVYAVARRPAGLRPALPRTFQAGVKVKL